jgi:hypothetical protein
VGSPNFAFATRVTGGAITINETVTEIPLTNLDEASAGWSVNPSGHLVIPTAGAYRVTYNVTVFYGSQGNGLLRVDTYVGHNGSTILERSHISLISVADARHQYIQGTTFRRSFNANDTLSIWAVVSNDTPPATTVPSNTSSLGNPIVTAMIDIEQYGI